MRIPTDETEMDVGWLADCLACDPTLIEDVNVSLPDHQSGLFGAIAFIEVQRKAGSKLPSNLVCKYVSLDPDTAEAVKTYEVFAREENFYRKFAPRLSIRTPTCFASKYDPDTGAGFLLLEDCSEFEERDLVSEVPSSLEELKMVVGTAARLCSSSWDRPWLLEDKLAMRPGQRVWEAYFQNMTNGWGEYLDHDLSALAAPGFDTVARDLSDTYIDRVRNSWPTDRLSLSHVDFHCGNYFFDPGNAEDPIVVFDWQGGAVGRTAQDLGAILAASFPPDFRREHERDIVTGFHRDLDPHHRSLYGEDECWFDYEQGILVSLRLLPQLVTELDLTSEYGAAAGAKIVRNLSWAVMDLGGARYLHRFSS